MRGGSGSSRWWLSARRTPRWPRDLDSSRAARAATSVCSTQRMRSYVYLQRFLESAGRSEAFLQDNEATGTLDSSPCGGARADCAGGARWAGICSRSCSDRARCRRRAFLSRQPASRRYRGLVRRFFRSQYDLPPRPSDPPFPLIPGRRGGSRQRVELRTDRLLRGWRHLPLHARGAGDALLGGRVGSAGRRMRLVLAGLLGIALLLPVSAEAAGRSCGGLEANGWQASEIHATHLTCGSARGKLSRWLYRALPHNPYGWNCFRWRGRRMCAVGNGDAPRFTFRLGRSPPQAPIRECGNYAPGGGAGVYNITTRITSCRTARWMVRRFYQGQWTVPPTSRPFWHWIFYCRNRKIGYESWDLRCAGTHGRAVRWQHGA